MSKLVGRRIEEGSSLETITVLRGIWELSLVGLVEFLWRGMVMATALAILPSSSSAEIRTWHRARDARPVEAEYVQLQGTNVLLNYQGNTLTVPIRSLSKQDRQWLKENGRYKTTVNVSRPFTTLDVPKGYTAQITKFTLAGKDFIPADGIVTDNKNAPVILQTQNVYVWLEATRRGDVFRVYPKYNGKTKKPVEFSAAAVRRMTLAANKRVSKTRKQIAQLRNLYQANRRGEIKDPPRSPIRTAASNANWQIEKKKVDALRARARNANVEADNLQRTLDDFLAAGKSELLLFEGMLKDMSDAVIEFRIIRNKK